MNCLPIATLLVGDRAWVIPATAMLLLAMTVIVIAYVRTPGDRRTRLAAMSFKVVGMLLLATCLLDPLLSSVRAKPGENLFAVLADNSSSLTIRSVNGPTRGEQFLHELENSESPWQVRLAQDFAVRRYQFDARLQRVDSFGDLDFAGTSSSVHGVLTSLVQRYRGQPLAGLLLFTDGNPTDQQSLDALASTGLPPVYPVLPVDSESPTDLSITRTTVSESVFEDAPVTIQAEITAHGDFEDGVTIEALDEAGTIIDTKRSAITQNEPLPVRFQVRPTRSGLAFYTLRVRDGREPESIFAESGTSREATLANNSRIVAVNRSARPYRVLYVAGRPNWEYRFLHRALRQDTQIELVALIRIARKEAKFDFRGRDDESSNPLFRGFKKEGDEFTESYDEPVLIRLGTRDESELRDGFPRDKSTLYEYDAIILDDLESEFFTHDQLALIERFVADRGGGLMMLGGIGTFQHGGYDRTPVGDALPVYLDRGMTDPPTDGYRLTLTRDGWLQPWMRLRSTEPEEQERLRAMPPFVSVTRIDSVKPGARILAVLNDTDTDPVPAIVAQSYGAGRALAVLPGDLWRWSLQRGQGQSDDLAKAWRQSVRWLVSDIPQRLELDASPNPDPEAAPNAVHLTIRARSAEYQPQENAELRVEVLQPDGQSVNIPVVPSLEETGLFTASFVAQSAGGYRATARWDAEEGQQFIASAGWTNDPAADEFRHTGIDRAGMQAIAESTGGEVVEIDQLEAFVEGLPTRRAPVTETTTSPVWHRSWVLLLVLACLTGEWGVRRLRGLP